jgi:hypothetical protein
LKLSWRTSESSVKRKFAELLRCLSNPLKVDRGVMRGRNGAKMIFWVDLVIWRLDRLGHSLQHQINTIDDLRKGQSSLNPFRTTSIQLLRGKLAFHLTAAISEFETDLIRERTRAGLSQQESGGDMVTVQRPQVPKRCKS